MNFSHKLLNWYAENHRRLPWRETRDPYRVWISEIILQQTRVAQGIGYYERFISRFPDLQSLAQASEEEVLKVWQGLGYYTRARNLHAAAGRVMELHGGKFPASYEEIRSLRGIGDYTAAAIGSICFGLAVPAIDGNVIRFLSRLFGIHAAAGSSVGRREIYGKAMTLLDPDHPGDSNQAMIEFGATWCVPRNPDCARCIFSSDCYAHARGIVAGLPVKPAPQKVTDRYFNYLVISFPDHDQTVFLIRKRQGRDIWTGLYDFPCIETMRPVSTANLRKTTVWSVLFGEKGPSMKQEGQVILHQLSHQRIHARFLRIRLNSAPDSEFMAVPATDLPGYPFPRLIERILPAIMKG